MPRRYFENFINRYHIRKTNIIFSFQILYVSYCLRRYIHYDVNLSFRLLHNPHIWSCTQLTTIGVKWIRQRKAPQPKNEHGRPKMVVVMCSAVCQPARNKPVLNMGLSENGGYPKLALKTMTIFLGILACFKKNRATGSSLQIYIWALKLCHDVSCNQHLATGYKLLSCLPWQHPTHIHNIPSFCSEKRVPSREVRAAGW